MLPVVVLAAVAALLLSPGLVSGPSLDAAIFTYAAERVTEGARLYADVWDHKPPGAYLVYAVFQFVLPFLSPWAVTWLISVVVTALTGATVMAAVQRVGVSPGAALFAAVGVVGAMSQYLTALGGGLTEPLATLPACVALVLAVAPGMNWRRSMVIGVFLSAALLTSLILLPGVLAIAAMTLARPGTLLDRVERAMAGVVGGLLAGVAVIGQLYLLGVLPEALDAVVRYASAYRESGGEFAAALSGSVATWSTLSYLFLIIPAALGILVAFRGDERRRIEAMACVAWIGLAIFAFAYQGRFYAHYVIPLAVPLGLLAGMGFQRLRVVRRRRGSELARLPLYAPFLLAFGISLVAGTAGARLELLPIHFRHVRSVATAETIRELTQPSDTIFVWGNSTQLYLDADRRAPVPYVYLYPLTTPGYSRPARINAALAVMEADPPRLVIDAGSHAPGAGGFLPLLVDRPVGTDGRTLDLLDPIRDFVRDNYEEVTRDSGWIVYALRTSG